MNKFQSCTNFFVFEINLIKYSKINYCFLENFLILIKF